MESGYCNCKCPDCFEIAMTDFDEETNKHAPGFCNECEAAGCDGKENCLAVGAYGVEVKWGVIAS